MFKHFFDGTVAGPDLDHFDYILKSALTNKTAVQEYVNLYSWERKPQLLFILLGTNCILEGVTSVTLKQTMEDFVISLQSIEYLSVNLDIENNQEQKAGSETEAYITADEDNGDFDLLVTISNKEAELI